MSKCRKSNEIPDELIEELFNIINRDNRDNNRCRCHNRCRCEDRFEDDRFFDNTDWCPGCANSFNDGLFGGCNRCNQCNTQ